MTKISFEAEVTFKKIINQTNKTEKDSLLGNE